MWNNATLAIVVLLPIGCGGGGVDGDASPPIDASDAVPWPCEPRPAPLPAPSSVTPTVVFDLELPLARAGDSSAVDTFFDGSQIIVVTPQHLHFVSLEGVLERSVLLELPDLGDGIVLIRDIARNGSGFGAVVMTWADGNVRFCQLDPVTGADESRCAQVGSGLMFDAKVVTDSSGYAVYAHEYLAGDYALRRWRFDGTGMLLETEELWRDPPPSRFLLNAGAGPSGILLVTGVGGDVYAHRLVDSTHTVESVRPEALSYAGMGVVLSAWTGDGNDALGYLRHMRCAVVDDEDYSQRMAVMTRFGLDEADETATALSLPLIASGAVMFDGDDTVIAYGWDFYDLRIARLAATGEALVSELRLPLPRDGEKFEIQFVAAGRAIGPGDYVFVYGGTGGFLHRRLARVTVPYGQPDDTFSASCAIQPKRLSPLPTM